MIYYQNLINKDTAILHLNYLDYMIIEFNSDFYYFLSCFRHDNCISTVDWNNSCECQPTTFMQYQLWPNLKWHTRCVLERPFVPSCWVCIDAGFSATCHCDQSTDSEGRLWERQQAYKTYQRLNPLMGKKRQWREALKPESALWNSVPRTSSAMR